MLRSRAAWLRARQDERRRGGVVNAELINVALEQMARRLARDDVRRNAELAASPDGVPPPAHSWRPLDLIELGSVKPQPPDIGGLIYAANGM